MLGENNLTTDPDCSTSGEKMCFPKKIVRTVAKAIVHDDYNYESK